MTRQAQREGGAVASSARPRRGLVLGAGGVLGAAWTVGAMHALEQERGFDLREVDIVLGTSAGSVLAAAIACGLSTATLLNHQRGTVADGDPEVDFDYDGDGPLPPRPRFRLGSRRLLAAAIRHPRHVRLIPALSALAPQGRGSIAAIGALIDSIAPAGDWPSRPRPWIASMDYTTGQRVTFGRAGAPLPTLSRAVMASCAIPGWYASVMIDGRPYVDGGAWSATSLDLLAHQRLDEVYCLAPMGCLGSDQPHSLLGKLERRIRAAITRRMKQEAEQVRADGAAVTVLAPADDDLRAIGVNMMDSRRRRLVLETSLRTSAATLKSDPMACGLAPAG